MLGIKQEALAAELGEYWTQKKVSLLEAKEEIEPELMEQVAKVLKVQSEAIKSFDELAAVNVIANTFNDDSFSHIVFNPNQCTFNTIDKIVELYERLLQSEKDRVQMLDKIINERK